jgi:hypothetical protein
VAQEEYRKGGYNFKVIQLPVNSFGKQNWQYCFILFNSSYNSLTWERHNKYWFFINTSPSTVCRELLYLIRPIFILLKRVRSAAKVILVFRAKTSSLQIQARLSNHFNEECCELLVFKIFRDCSHGVNEYSSCTLYDACFICLARWLMVLAITV